MSGDAASDSPHGTLPAGTRLETYFREFDTVELNASFYRWPPPARFAGWRDRLLQDFEMAVKAPRGLTHARRLLRSSHQRDDSRLDWFLRHLPAWMRPVVEFRQRRRG